MKIRELIELLKSYDPEETLYVNEVELDSDHIYWGYTPAGALVVPNPDFIVKEREGWDNRPNMWIYRQGPPERRLCIDDGRG